MKGALKEIYITRSSLHRHSLSIADNETPPASTCFTFVCTIRINFEKSLLGFGPPSRLTTFRQ